MLNDLVHAWNRQNCAEPELEHVPSPRVADLEALERRLNLIGRN